MYLSKLQLSNFKNYTTETLQFSQKLNCFVGENGMGKTNLLDAIHYLCMCKSHFAMPDKLTTKHGEAFYRVEGNFKRLDRSYTIVCKYDKQKQKKVMESNRVAYKRLADHIGIFPLVMIAPDDTQLILEGSENRRQFLDFLIVQVDHNYLKQLMIYNKLLKHRNSILKESDNPHYIDFSLLEIYDQQMLIPAAYIHQKRKEIATTFKPIFQKYYKAIAADKEQVDFEYHSQLHEASLSELLIQAQERDRWLQRTTKGIHKDDLKLKVNGYPLKRFASQGQLKSYLLALKLAQYELIRQKNEVAPILLLDDIFDKLDKNRVQQLLELLMEQQFGQIFITDTHEKRVENIANQLGTDYQQFKIIEGAVQSSLSPKE
ncbi:MAG: DNA replication/repair protein RecF [Saprospiraceae bacterium]|nr:DNA replication/repair protein RecF [Saprospiraceae bacterium]